MHKKTMNQSRRDILTFLGSTTALSLLPYDLSSETINTESAEQNIPYTVAEKPWPALLGNQRVRIYIENAAEAVWVHIPWRRVDHNPEKKAVLVVGPDGSRVINAAAVMIGAEYGDILFEAKSPGDHFIYYLPQAGSQISYPKGESTGQYQSSEPSGDPLWLRRFAASSTITSRDKRQQLPQARVIEFQARTSFDSLYPMQIAATEYEVQQLCLRHPQSVLLFLEDREHPIQMHDKLPLRWIQTGPQHSFSGTALQGEFYVFQIGIYTNRYRSAEHTNISVRFDDLIASDGTTISASSWECMNTSGIDANGQLFHKEIIIPQGEVAVLWCGVQVPLDAKSTKYNGNIYLVSSDESNSQVYCELEVTHDFIRDSGVDQPWRLSRIKWLNSTVGSEDTVTSPYIPLETSDRTVSCLGRTVQFGDNGFPTSIIANNIELLAAPIELKVYGASKHVQWKSHSAVTSTQDARVLIDSVSSSNDYVLHVHARMEFDGSINFSVTLVSLRIQSVSDIALEIPYVKNAVPYAVGMGLRGGRRPDTWQWMWSEQPQRWKDQGSNLECFTWLGGVEAGLFCRLKSPLEDWINGTKGGVGFAETKNCALFKASSGHRRLREGEELHFSFRLLPTPVKPLDPRHWTYRYAQSYQPPAKLKALGATVINLHQSTLPNLYINYPFLNLDLLVPYVNTSHTLGMKVKLYYTIRELTTRLPELWTFRSLHNEIYRVGGTQGGGHPGLDFWLQEHLRDNYAPGWIQVTSAGDIDTSLRVYSDSRLANFYLEGLKWLLENVQIDGIYLDEIGYSRETMQRVRRVLELRPGTMIDLHGFHNGWSCNCPIGYYMEHLPYIDRLWFGEAFDPNSSPEFWLIEMSGIPFGLSSDMLQNPNPWRGMLFGMTDRPLYSGPSPTPIWKLWDTFGIQDSIMIGWWEKDSPVKTGRSDVLATLYRKDEKSLISIASWAKILTTVQLEINWEKLGIDKHKARITAPKIDEFQDECHFVPDQLIPVPPGKGWLIIIEQS
ncbi:MAG: glycoside hydrolase domain-containing protein [Acidobacteriaceae bacterium]